MTTKSNRGDAIFRAATMVFAASIPLLFFLIFLMLVWQSRLSLFTFGPGFFFNSAWNPVRNQYGALPFIYGTLISSLLALVIAAPLGVGCAIYLSEVSTSRFKEWIATMVDLLAAIPSVVYGLWGIFVLGPIFGLSLMSAGVLLAIMILPTITAISREVLQAVPGTLRESARALGATRWETIKLSVLPPAASGIIGSIVLGLGRAIGETMAVTMVIGNRPEISGSLLAPGYSLSAVLANEFAEASSDLNFSVMIEIGLILLFITVLVNGLARLLVWKMVSNSRIQ
ncbi:MAG: phosphate ABC transporter permease subunit PstC [Candidatus Margulisbacteria bacterium]|nr:phosphate ABC transporter permease subunit PstC [Candidatus Margulisiibacteriota bacterium]